MTRHNLIQAIVFPKSNAPKTIATFILAPHAEGENGRIESIATVQAMLVCFSSEGVDQWSDGDITFLERGDHTSITVTKNGLRAHERSILRRAFEGVARQYGWKVTRQFSVSPKKSCGATVLCYKEGWCGDV